MLKYITKVLFIGMLSGSLMLLDFSPRNGISLSVAQAQEKFKSEKMDDSNLMSTLTMTAVGILASRLYQCKMSPDMMLAAAGGAAFLAGDILSFVKLKDVLKEMEVYISRDKNGKILDEQVESLKELRKSYAKAKETAETKKTLQTAAAAAFAAAAALSYSLYASHKGAYTACSAAIKTAPGTCQTEGQTTCASKCSATTFGYAACVAACMVPYQAAVASLTSANPTVVSNGVNDDTPKPSNTSATTSTTLDGTQTGQIAGASICTSSQASSTACKGYIVAKKNAEGFCPVPPVAQLNDVIKHIHTGEKALYANNNTLTNPSLLMKRVMGFFVGDANAMLSAMGIASTVAVKFVFATVKSLGATIDLYLYSPLNRAIAWGMLSALTFTSISSIDTVIEQLESNISQLDAIIETAESAGLGAGTGLAAGPNTQTPQGGTKDINRGGKIDLNAKNYEDINLGEDGETALPCFTGGDSNNCPSFDSKLAELPAYQSMDPTSQLELSNMLKGYNGFNGSSKISKGALSDAAKIGASANALRARANAMKKEAREKLKAEGKANLAGDIEDRMQKDFENAVNSNLKKSGMNASQMYASMYGGSASGLGTTAATGVNSENAGGAGLAIDSGAIGVGAAAIPGASFSMGSDLILSEDEDALSGLAGSDLAAGADVGIYELNDISKDTGASLFDMISNRYQKSGFQRLFRVKETVKETAKEGKKASSSSIKN